MARQSVWTPILIAGLLLAGCSFQFSCKLHMNHSAERDDHVSASMAPGQTLTVKTSFGGITVRGGDVETCEVQAHVRVQASKQDKADALLEQVTVSLEPRGNGLYLHLDHPHLGSHESVSAGFEVIVPYRTQLDCTTSHAKICIEQTEGDVQAKTSFGSVDCTNVIGALDLKSSHGQIDMQNIQASRIFADTSFARVRLMCQDAQTPPEKIVLKTSHGSIEAKNVRTRDLEARTSFGSVSIRYAPDGPDGLDARLSSSHGSLSLTPPQDYQGSVELSTSHGSINLDRPITVQGNLSKDRISGTLGQGSGFIRMTTSFGSVNLH